MKQYLLGIVFLLGLMGGGSALGQMMNISIANSSICAGANVTISYTITGGSFGSGTYVVELSDDMFTTASTHLATLSTIPSPGPIIVTIPLSTTPGTGYSIRIVSTGGPFSIISNVINSLTINAVPDDIMGLSSVCGNATIDLSDGTTPGTWSSSSTGIATVDPASGVVSGVSTGTAAITYTETTNNCTTTQTVTVNAPTITAPASICTGAIITTIDPTPAGGTWSSSNTAAATIGSTTGVLTGVNPGPGVLSTVITYTASGCTTTAIVTVNPSPAPIVGNVPVCENSSITLTDATSPGVGVWSTSGTATVNATSGVVTAPSTSATTATNQSVTYTVAGCSATTLITVNPVPNVGGLTTTVSPVCAGSSATVGVNSNSTSPGGGLTPGLTDATYTVTYSLSGANTGTGLLASMPATTGGHGTFTSAVVSNPGSTTVTITSIQYSNTGCSISLTSGSGNTATFTVNAGGVDAITTGGTATVCAGAVLPTFTDATPGGTWSSAMPGIATIGSSTGIVGGVSSGTTTISYNITNGCGTQAATQIVTVNAIPLAGTITGTTNVCPGTTITLSGSTPGGVWSSSNASAATVGSTGIVTGVSGLATTTISYTVTNVCGTATPAATKTVTVNPAPASPDPITGTLSVCASGGGSVLTTTLLSDATPAGVWSSSATGTATITSSGTVHGVSAGTVTISYTTSTTCGSDPITAIVTVNPVPVISGTTTRVCADATITLTSTTTGGTWSSSAPSNASVDASTGIVTGGNVTVSGNTTISYTSNPGCAATSITITANPLPAAIGGTLNVCVGSTTPLSDASGGGAWASSSTAEATINSSGTVGGVDDGTPTITYTLPTGCKTTTPVTVNPLPAAIGGTVNVCAGSTTALSDASGGGAWAISGSPSVATINTTGTISGVSNGTPTVTYTLPTGCKITTPVTVNPLPAAIGGTANVCVGSTTTLSDASGGGGWSSSNALLATINATGGTVGGVSNGTPIVTYTLPTGCKITTPVTVNPLPAAIGGTADVCAGSTTTLSDASSGGGWSSSNTSLATINATGGTVSGISAGTPAITYTLPTGCKTTTHVTVNALPAISGGSSVAICYGLSTTLNATGAGTGGSYSWSPGTALSCDNCNNPTASPTATTTYVVTGTNSNSCVNTSTVTVTVNPLPTAISGIASVCAGLTTTLNSTPSGGAWSSSNTSNASVGPSGVVTGGEVSASGNATITYTLPVTGCSIETVVTVNPLPASITGTDSVCAGSQVTLTDGTAGGSWSSSATSFVTIVPGSGIATGVAPGTATITYALGTSCITTIAIKVNQLPATPTITTSPASGTICDGTMYQDFSASSATNGVSYRWSATVDSIASGRNEPNSRVNFPPGTTSGKEDIVTVTVTLPLSAGGCHSEMQTTVNVSSNAAPPVDSVIWFEGSLVCLQRSDVTYLWGTDTIATMNSSILQGDDTNQNYYFTPTLPEEDFTKNLYWVITSYTNGCAQKSYYSAPAGNKGPNTNTTTGGLGDMKVYPNPASGFLEVHFDNFENNVSLQITDLLGRQVLILPVQSAQTTIDISGLQPSMYFLDCYLNGVKVADSRFVKN